MVPALTAPRPCCRWLAGSCSRGEACPYPHSDESPGSPGVPCSYSPLCEDHAERNGYKGHHQMFKTRMCVEWQAGRCRVVGEQCHFAHGEAELRSKRAPCKHWGTPQGCSFGDTCLYAHGKGELRPSLHAGGASANARFSCEACGVTCSSETAYDAHMSGKKH
eukprot:gene54013-5383_t